MGLHHGLQSLLDNKALGDLRHTVVEVSEIGRRSLLKSETAGTLGNGGTSANFHTRGTPTSEKEAFRMSAMGAAKISAYSFRTQFGMSSGPHARKNADLMKLPHDR